MPTTPQLPFPQSLSRCRLPGISGRSRNSSARRRRRRGGRPACRRTHARPWPPTAQMRCGCWWTALVGRPAKRRTSFSLKRCDCPQHARAPLSIRLHARARSPQPAGFCIWCSSMIAHCRGPTTRTASHGAQQSQIIVLQDCSTSMRAATAAMLWCCCLCVFRCGCLCRQMLVPVSSHVGATVVRCGCLCHQVPVRVPPIRARRQARTHNGCRRVLCAASPLQRDRTSYRGRTARPGPALCCNCMRGSEISPSVPQ